MVRAWSQAVRIIESVFGTASEVTIANTRCSRLVTSMESDADRHVRSDWGQLKLLEDADGDYSDSSSDRTQLPRLIRM